MKLIEIIKYIVENPNTGFYYTPPIYSSSKSYLFTEVKKEIKFFKQDGLTECLHKIDSYCKDGLTGFGYINYEFGYLLEDRLKKFAPNSEEKPLLHFLFCSNDSIKVYNSTNLYFSQLEDHIGKDVTDNFKINTSQEEYLQNVDKIKRYIAEGDTYQVNYTVKAEFSIVGSIVDLFAQLIFSQSASYTVIINFGDKLIISSSPELFFEIHDDIIKVKPMKGTIDRGKNITEDEKKKKELLESEKERAENIMIVDLLRNDIGKICDYGSVEVTNQYNLEKYESVFQLTSEIKGKLNTKYISEIITNLFPSGSITGAPKLRTMEIINELETESRGVYTGLIGMFSKSNSVANVAIRTLEIDAGKRSGELGIGSGIVWDSVPKKEWNEVLLKSKFLTEPLKYFELIESMLYVNGKIFLLEFHLRRLKEAADYFLFLYDEQFIISKLEDITASLAKNYSYKLRLLLSKWGQVKITFEQINILKGPVDVVVSNEKIFSENRFQYFKTTNRNLYDNELKKYRDKGYYEVLFLNEKGNAAEGAISNILIQTGKEMITPPVKDGILNGCYRQYILTKTNLKEQSITLEQLINSEKIILINSIRKELVVNKIFDSTGKLLREFH